MSNFLAIATVTAALSQVLRDGIQSDVAGADVTTLDPSTSGGAVPATRVNLFLYQVTPNAAWRNADLPTRRSDGQLVQRPQVALDLHYLLTFYGDEGQLEPQRLLGSAVRTLHERPLLTRQKIEQTIMQPPFDTFLGNSNLADGVELVKFTPTSLSLEELSKLWSVFFQISYRLSAAYQGTVVLIESEEVPQMALPVRERNVYVMPFRQPVIEQIIAQAGANQPIVIGSTAIILGRQLRGDITRVRIGGLVVAPQDVTDSQIIVQLSSPPFPANALRAGVQPVQVIHQLHLGTPADPHRGFESNVTAFVLRPTISSVSASTTQVTLQLNPIVGARQRVVLLLNERSATDPAAYTFIDEARPTDTDSIEIAISDVKAAEYLVRVQVDGAESPLTVDTNPVSPTFNQYIGPTVTAP